MDREDIQFVISQAVAGLDNTSVAISLEKIAISLERIAETLEESTDMQSKI
jgi:hypothetical protein